MAFSKDGNYETELKMDLMLAFLAAGEDLEIDPLSSIEAEAYFLNLQNKIDTGIVKVEEVKQLLRQDFVCLGATPVWIQSDEWQYDGSGPMIFVGQIDAPEGSIVGNKSFYLFQSKNSSNTKIVVQVG